jgi:hypothetical protein
MNAANITIAALGITIRQSFGGHHDNDIEPPIILLLAELNCPFCFSTACRAADVIKGLSLWLM